MENVLRFYELAAKLKTTRRAGWARCGVEPCESVADHSFGVALLALLLPKLAGVQVNRNRCVALALVHDLAESIVGDITPHDAIDPAEKRRREGQAMAELAGILNDPEVAELWREFEQGQTEEARLVRELDVIEMAWQAVTYRRSGKLTDPQAQQFIASARSRVTSSTARQMLDTVISI